MPKTKSGFKNWQRITALFLVFIFSAEQISYAGGFNDTLSGIKSTLQSKAQSAYASARTSYSSGTQYMRANYPTVFNTVKPLIAGVDLARSVVTRSSPAFYNSWTAGNRQALPNAARAYDSNGPFGAAFYGVGLVTNPVIEKVTGIKAGSAEAKSSLQVLHKWIPAPVNLAIKASIGKDLDNPYVSTKQGWDKITSITPKEAVIGALEVGFPVIGKGLTALVEYAGITSTSLGLGATSTYLNTKVLPLMTKYVGPKVSHGLSYAWQGTKGALTLPERLITPYISSNAGKWLATYSIRAAQYEAGLYGFRQSGLENALVPKTSAYRPAVDTTLDYVMPFFIAPGRGGVAKETTKAFFTGGGIKTFAQTGIESLGNLKNKATFSTLKSVAETIPAKLTRESIKSGIVNAGKTWAKEAKLGYVNLASEGKLWVPIKMLQQGTHVAQDLAVFSAGTAVASGTLNKAGVKRVNIPLTNIGVDTLEFKNLPHALNTISEYSAGGAINGLVFGSAMSVAGPIVGPVVSRTPVLGRFMRWYDDTYGNKLFETAGLEKRLTGNSFWSKQGISFINKFNRAQNFLAEEFWVFREPLAGAVFSRLPMPAGAQEYLEESITDYGKRGTGSITFGLDTLHSIQSEGGVKEFVAKKIGGIADALGEIKLPNPLPMVAAAAPNSMAPPAQASYSTTSPETGASLAAFSLDYSGKQTAQPAIVNSGFSGNPKESVWRNTISPDREAINSVVSQAKYVGQGAYNYNTNIGSPTIIATNILKGTNNYLSKFVQGPFLEMSRPDYDSLVKNPVSSIETYKAISSITIPYKEKILGELEDAKGNKKPVVKYYHAASLEKALFVERTGLYNPALSLINPTNTANERPIDTRKIYSYVSQESKDNSLNDYTDPARPFLIEISVPADSQFSQIQGKSSDSLYFSGIASARVLGANELPVGVTEQRIKKGGPAASYYASQLNEKSYVQVSDASVLNILTMQENKGRVFSPYGSKAVGYYIPENINIKPNNHALGYRQDGSLDIFNIKTGEVVHHAEPVFFENSNLKPADVITMPQPKDFTKSPAIAQGASTRLKIIINDLRFFLQTRGVGNVAELQLEELAERIYDAQLAAASGAVIEVDLTGFDIPGITSADSRALGTMGMGGLSAATARKAELVITKFHPELGSYRHDLTGEQWLTIGGSADYVYGPDYLREFSVKGTITNPRKKTEEMIQLLMPSDPVAKRFLDHSAIQNIKTSKLEVEARNLNVDLQLQKRIEQMLSEGFIDEETFVIISHGHFIAGAVPFVKAKDKGGNYRFDVAIHFPKGRWPSDFNRAKVALNQQYQVWSEAFEERRKVEQQSAKGKVVALYGHRGYPNLLGDQGTANIDPSKLFGTPEDFADFLKKNGFKKVVIITEEATIVPDQIYEIPLLRLKEGDFAENNTDLYEYMNKLSRLTQVQVVTGDMRPPVGFSGSLAQRLGEEDKKRLETVARISNKINSDAAVDGGGISQSATLDAASIPPAKLASPDKIYSALGKVIEPGQPRTLDKFLAFIIERHSLHDKLRVILGRVLRRKPQAEIEISRPDTQIVKESPAAFEYVSSSQKFQGVDLEHFVHAQRRLARKELSREELRGVLKKLSLKQELANEDKLDLAYAGIYKELAKGNYNKDIIDTINGFDPLAGKSTYSDPRLNIAIIDQSGDARSQGVYEAVSNSLDALGFKIGQFGKGVKQIIDWLEPTGRDRIDVYSKKENEPAHQLTILKDTKGQNYLQIQIISDSEFRDTAKAISSRVVDRGTIVKVTTQKDIPLEDSQHKEQNSQSAIAAGIHKRFPFITNIPILIQIDNQEPQKVNGFREKKVIVPARQKNYQPKEKEDNFVHLRLDKHNIAIVDNGKGMDARVLSGMFVPEGGTKSPEFLSGRQIEEELDKVEVVHDKNLPHRVSFARNGEVIFTVDIPQEIHPDATLPGAGGLMLELGLLLDVQESRDKIVLKVGKENGFQKGVMYAINQILKLPELSAVDKIRYINTIVIGLDGLIKGNENNAEVIKAIRQNILAELQAVIDNLRKDNFVVLPYQNEFGKFKVSQGKNVLFAHENLFHWGIDTLKELGAEIVPGIKLAGDKRLPLVVVPFKEEHLSAVSKFDKNWHNLSADERVPVIKTDRFVAVPEEFGKRVLELSQKRIKGLTQGKEELSEAEKLEFASLLELIKIITSDEVVTSYEVAAPKESLALEEIKFQESHGAVDSPAINKFLTEMPKTAIPKLTEAEKFKSEILTKIDKTAADPAGIEADAMFKEAFNIIEKSLSEEPLTFKLRKIYEFVRLAEELIDSGRIDEAKRIFESKEVYKIISDAKLYDEMENDSLVAFEGRFLIMESALVLAKLGKHKQALQIIERIKTKIKNDHYESKYLSDIAKVLAISDRIEAKVIAIAIAKEAFVIAKAVPGNSEAEKLDKILSLSAALEALVSVDSGMVDAAVSAVEEEVWGTMHLFKDDKKARMISYAANALAQSGRVDKVLSLREKAVKIKGEIERAEALSSIAMALADRFGFTYEANQIVEEALNIARSVKIEDQFNFKPLNHSGALFGIAKVLAKLGKFDEAISVAEEAFRIIDTEKGYAEAVKTEHKVAILLFKVDVLSELERFDEAKRIAKEAYTKIITLGNQSIVRFLSELGKALTKLAQARGQTSSAEAQPRKAPEELVWREIANELLIAQAITQANAIEDPFHKAVALIPVLKKLVETGRISEAMELAESIGEDKKDDLGLEGVYYRYYLGAVVRAFEEKNIGMLTTIAISDTPVVDKQRQLLLRFAGVYILVEAGAIDEAIKLIDSIGVIKEPNYQVNNARARIAKALAGAGRIDEAIKQLELVGFNTNEILAHIFEILVDAGKTDEAIKIAGNYVPRAETYGPILKALVKAGRTKEATELIKPWVPNYNADSLKEEFLSTLIKALDGKTDNKIIDKLVNQIVDFPVPVFEKAYLSSIIITAIPDRMDEKIIDKLIEQVIADKSADTINIMVKALVKAGKINNARKLINSFETNITRLNPNVRVSFVEALMSQTYKEITITTSEGARTPSEFATAKQSALFSDTRPQDAPNQFEIIPHPNGKFYVQFNMVNFGPQIILRSSEGRGISTEMRIETETKMYTRIERVGTKGNTFIGYREDGSFSIFRQDKMLYAGDEKFRIVDKKGDLIVIEITQNDQKGYFVYDLIMESRVVNLIKDPLSKKITLSASGRFSIHEQSDGRLVYYDHTEKDMRSHQIFPTSDYKGYRVHEKADVVIVQESSGKYHLFNLKKDSLSLYVDHIEIDSSGQVAIIKQDGKLDYLWIDPHGWPQPAAEKMDKIRVSSNDKYTYLMKLDKDGYIKETVFFDKNTGDKYAIAPAAGFSSTGDEIPVRFWEEYDLEKKTIWDRDSKRDFAYTKKYVRSSPVDLKKADFSLYDNVVVDINKENDHYLDLGNLDGVGLPGSTASSYHVKDALSLQGGKVWYILFSGGTSRVVVMTEEKVIDLARFSRFFVTQNNKFILGEGSKDGIRFLIDNRGNFKYIEDEIPEGFIPTEANGDYFVFVNPDTRQIKYLDPHVAFEKIPEQEETPVSFEEQIARQKAKEEAEKTIKHWQDSVLSKRDAFIAQARLSYQPLLELAPAEHKIEIEKEISKQIIRLYEEQDKIIRKRFAEAQDKSGDIDLAELPFEHFEKTMQRIGPVLKEYIGSLNNRISQEPFDAQRDILASLFTNLFEFSMHPELSLEAIDANLLEIVSSGWDITTQGGLDIAPVIGSLIQGVKEINPAIGIPRMRKIVRFLSDFLSDNPVNNKSIVEAQLKKILEAKEQIRKSYLEKMLVAFKDIGQKELDAYLKQPSAAKVNQLGQAREFVVFLTNKVEHLENRERFIPEGIEKIPAGKEVSITQIIQLEEKRRKSAKNNEPIMSVAELISAIEQNNLPESYKKQEEKILLDTKVQIEPGGYPREIAQNSKDATGIVAKSSLSGIDSIKGTILDPNNKNSIWQEVYPTYVRLKPNTVLKEEVVQEIVNNKGDFDKVWAILQQSQKGELLVSFYLQENEQGTQEYVEEATDNGTGALDEIVLLMPQSTKAGGGQIELGGFFGTGNLALFEGVDRLEKITNNGLRAYMFSFLVNRDPSGNPVAIRLTNIRQISDSKVAQGVTVRRIKATVNTIPELDQMLARRSWKTFAGLSQNENFNIYFTDKLGKKELLEVKKEVLSQADFIVPKRGQQEQTNSGIFRIISCEDMPLQVIDRAGLRIGEIKEEYLELIPESLRKHIEELGITIQIPLPLIRNRSDFELANYYLPYIQKYLAIEFYKVLAYKALTQTSPQFVFENLPFDWETNDDYWNSISLEDKAIVGLADKINKKDLSSITGAELKSLLPEEKGLDTEKKLLKLILLLKVETGKPQPESLLLRRLAVQAVAQNQANAEAQMRALEEAGMKVSSSEVPDRKDIPHLLEKVSQALSIKTGHEQMKHIEDYLVPVENYTQQEKKLVELARSIALLFGLEDILLAEDNVSFAGGFITINGRKIMALQRSLANQMGMASGANVDEATNAIVHELAHLLEEFMRQGLTNRMWDLAKVLKSGYITPNFTHDAVGTFAEAMKYVAGVTLANHKILESQSPQIGKPATVAESVEGNTVKIRDSNKESTSIPPANLDSVENTQKLVKLYDEEKFKINHAQLGQVNEIVKQDFISELPSLHRSLGQMSLITVVKLGPHSREFLLETKTDYYSLQKFIVIFDEKGVIQESNGEKEIYLKVREADYGQAAFVKLVERLGETEEQKIMIKDISGKISSLIKPVKGDIKRTQESESLEEFYNREAGVAFMMRSFSQTWVNSSRKVAEIKQILGQNPLARLLLSGLKPGLSVCPEVIIYHEDGVILGGRYFAFVRTVVGASAAFLHEISHDKIRDLTPEQIEEFAKIITERHPDLIAQIKEWWKAFENSDPINEAFATQLDRFISGNGGYQDILELFIKQGVLPQWMHPAVIGYENAQNRIEKRYYMLLADYLAKNGNLAEASQLKQLINKDEELRAEREKEKPSLFSSSALSQFYKKINP